MSKINCLEFEQILRMPQKELKKALTGVLANLGYEPVAKKGYLYGAGMSPVMLVAHLDTVHREPVRDICYSMDGKIVMSPQGIGGDDRAGVYMALQIAEQVPCHILFCEDEEIGGKGAQQFIRSGIEPQINYIVEMDRRGHHDAVFYQCDNRRFVSFVTGFGFQEAFGSFSDISVIAPHLGVAAVNISAGYYNEHRTHEHINMNHVAHNISRITEMVQAPSDVFTYIKARGSGFGRFYGEQLPLWGAGELGHRTALMPLPQTAHVVVSGVKVDNGLAHFIDENGTVYDYLEEVDAVVPAEHTAAFAEDGMPLKFLKRAAQKLQTLSLEEAMEQLCG